MGVNILLSAIGAVRTHLFEKLNYCGKVCQLLLVGMVFGRHGYSWWKEIMPTSS
jgi:hypothetical protein